MPKNRVIPEAAEKEKIAGYQRKRRKNHNAIGLMTKNLYIDSKTNDFIEKIAEHLAFDTSKEREKTKRESAVVFYAIRKLAFDIGLLDTVIPPFFTVLKSRAFGHLV